jgi:predicted phage tail protein
VTLPIFGYENALFRCTGFKFAVNLRGINLTLQRDDPSAYAWTAGQAQTYAAAPAVSLFEPWNVAPPTGLALSNDPLTATGGASVPAIKASWAAADDAYVTGYEVEYKLHVDADWISAGIVAAAPAWVYPVTIGAVYDLRVTAIRGNGARSAPAELDSFTAGGDTVAPGAPTAISATGFGGSIQLDWTNDGAADLAFVEIWRSATNDSSTANKITDQPSTPSSSGGYTDMLSSGATRYYWLKSRDGSGNRSPFSGVVSATAL